MNGLTQMSRGLLSALILSVIIAFMISLIPNVGGFQLNQEVSVFKQREQIQLTEDNLVNFVSNYPINLSLKRVMFRHTTLSVDFMLQSQLLDTNTIYQDVYTTIKQSLLKSSNVEEVLLRVFLNDEQIFVAISANRKDIAANPMMEIPKNVTYKEFLDQNFGLNFGNLIKQE